MHQVSVKTVVRQPTKVRNTELCADVKQKKDAEANQARRSVAMQRREPVDEANSTAFPYAFVMPLAQARQRVQVSLGHQEWRLCEPGLW